MDVKELPPAVIERCEDCGYCGPTSGGWNCEHRAVYPAPGYDVGGYMVEPDLAPPSWCPLRRKA